jgi:hypothetical protein
VGCVKEGLQQSLNWQYMIIERQVCMFCPDQQCKVAVTWSQDANLYN